MVLLFLTRHDTVMKSRASLGKHVHKTLFSQLFDLLDKKVVGILKLGLCARKDEVLRNV